MRGCEGEGRRGGGDERRRGRGEESGRRGRKGEIDVSYLNRYTNKLY